MEKIFLIVFLFCSACSLAPVVSEKTARTLGDGNWETNVGMSPAVSVTVGRGFGERFDLHFSYESQIVPIVEVGGKFSILQNNDGLSFSLFGGGFTDGGSSSGYYAGLLSVLKKIGSNFMVWPNIIMSLGRLMLQLTMMTPFLILT